MLLRCERCLSKFAHDLLHCPQCGVEAAGNTSPDPDVVGTAEPASEPPAAEPVVPDMPALLDPTPPAEPAPAEPAAKTKATTAVIPEAEDPGQQAAGFEAKPAA